MIHRITGLRDRLLSAFAIVLCVVLLAIVANTLKSSISTTVAPQPPQSAPTSGISLLALLFLLLNAFFAFFGITLEPPSGGLSGGSILELILMILQIIFQHRFVIISTAVLITVVSLLYQYRHHLAVPRVFQPDKDIETTTNPSTATANSDWPPDAQLDTIQEAWIMMIQHIGDIENPSSRTPTEWQQLAIDAGLPTDAVETITASFCATQYGNVPETDIRRRHVRIALNKLDRSQEVADE